MRPGLPAYEISNHARPGAECRHNLAYWRYEDYLGIGPGAHGRVTREGGKIATAQLRQPEAWLAAVESAGTAIDEEIPIARDSAVEEMVMMGLRLVEGVSRPRLEALADADVETLFGPRLTRLIEGGFLTLEANGSPRPKPAGSGLMRFWGRCSRNHSPICSSAPRVLALRKAIKKIAAPIAR